MRRNIQQALFVPVLPQLWKTPKNDKPLQLQGFIGAGDGNRTHDIQLGKLTFYL
jgi:hypothetical protein